MLKKLDVSQPESKGQNGFEYSRQTQDEMVSLLNMNKGWEIERELNGGGKFIMKRKA